VRQPPVWSNGDAATVNRTSSLPSISQGSWRAANPDASAIVARIITAKRSGPIRSTVKSAGTVRKNGAPATLTTGVGISEQHPAAVEQNRQQQQVRDQKRRLRNLANNNSAFDLKHCAAEVWLLGADLQNLANNNSVPAQVWVLEALPPRKPPQSESCKQQRPGAQATSAG
jgi:hypothetical protein